MILLLIAVIFISAVLAGAVSDWDENDMPTVLILSLTGATCYMLFFLGYEGDIGIGLAHMVILWPIAAGVATRGTIRFIDRVFNYPQSLSELTKTQLLVWAACTIHTIGFLYLLE